MSKYPQCTNDISFWVSETSQESLPEDDKFSSNDFYDLVRSVGGETVEQVELVDEFFHPKKKRLSHCYRIVYRAMDRTLTQDEVNEIHKEIENESVKKLGVELR